MENGWRASAATATATATTTTTTTIRHDTAAITISQIETAGSRRHSMRTGQPRAEPRSGAAPMGSRARRRMHGCDGIFVRGARSPRFGVPPARLRLAIGFDGRMSMSHPPPRQASDRDEPADEVRRLGRAIRRYIGDVGARRWARHRRTRISRAPRDPAIAAAPGVHRGEAAAPPAPRQRSGGRRFTVDAARAAARSRAAGRSTDVG